MKFHPTARIVVEFIILINFTDTILLSYRLRIEESVELVIFMRGTSSTLMIDDNTSNTQREDNSANTRNDDSSVSATDTDKR